MLGNLRIKPITLHQRSRFRWPEVNTKIDETDIMASQHKPTPSAASTSPDGSKTVTLSSGPDRELREIRIQTAGVAFHGDDFPVDAKNPILRTAEHEAEDRSVSLARRLTNVHLEWPNEAGVSRLWPLYVLLSNTLGCRRVSIACGVIEVTLCLF